MKLGDLIRLKDGQTVYAVTDVYTHRFMEACDYEMMSHGMGHLAGVYGPAIDVLSSSTGLRKRIRLGVEKCEVVSEGR
jgi:hypothetical protein